MYVRYAELFVQYERSGKGKKEHEDGDKSNCHRQAIASNLLAVVVIVIPTATATTAAGEPVVGAATSSVGGRRFF